MKVGESFITENGALVTYVKAAQPMGEYKPTSVDAAKADADFLVIEMTRTGAVIDWRNGKRERVSDAKLERLQSSHKWATNF